MLAETDILEETARYFYETFIARGNNSFLVFITTEKERTLSQPRPDTIGLARKIAKENPRIIHIHFPKSEGKMAYQLNYAIDILTSKGKVEDDDLFAVYNADSRPEKETFSWVLEKFKKGNIRAFQQYGCYTGNISQLKHFSWGSVLVSAALWQTRWAIGFEIFNALKQLKFIGKKISLRLNYPFNYCIGHGFFATRGLLKEIGGFNEGVHNEDAILGLQLCDMQEPFMPIPYFDISESPDSISMLYKQKSNWYFGPLQAYAYVIYILKKESYSVFRKMRLFILSSKLFSHAIFWIVGPSLIFLSVIIAFLERDAALLGITLASFAAFSLPNLISYRFMRQLGITSSSVGEIQAVKTLFKGSFICYMLHGASAYRGLLKYIKQVISGQAAVKEKTVIRRLRPHGRPD